VTRSCRLSLLRLFRAPLSQVSGFEDRLNEEKIAQKNRKKICILKQKVE
jgi:hypothetical protein